MPSLPGSCWGNAPSGNNPISHLSDWQTGNVLVSSVAKAVEELGLSDAADRVEMGTTTWRAIWGQVTSASPHLSFVMRNSCTGALGDLYRNEHRGIFKRRETQPKYPSAE